MIITIVSSSVFIKQMVEYRDQLIELGHQVNLHKHYVAQSDAILVLNFDKNGIKNYIGGNTPMELGFAHVHHKKIFLLNPIPDMNCKDEIEAMEPVVINMDLGLIG